MAGEKVTTVDHRKIEAQNLRQLAEDRFKLSTLKNYLSFIEVLGAAGIIGVVSDVNPDLDSMTTRGNTEVIITADHSFLVRQSKDIFRIGGDYGNAKLLGTPASNLLLLTTEKKGPAWRTYISDRDVQNAKTFLVSSGMEIKLERPINHFSDGPSVRTESVAFIVGTK